MPITQTDLELFINENYFVFLLLGGLLILMYAYRDVRLPASRNFLLIILVLFLMSVANGLERWAVCSPDRDEIRTIASVAHYILQPFVIYLELLVIIPGKDRGHRLNRLIITLPILLNTVIYLVAPFTGSLVFNFDEDYCFNRGPLGSTIYIVTLIYLVLLLFWTVRLLKTDRRRSIILFFMAGIALLTGVLEGLNIVTGYIDEAFALGVFLYYLYLITVHEAELQSSLARRELELSRNEVALLRQQIRPHFIFNALHIIKSLIRTDQEKAVQGVEDFSDYLRANFDALTTDSLIPFEDELSHIEAYVSLVLADDSRNITVDYDIRERDILIPPLSVEPLVENAIRHGVPQGGIVRVASYATGDKAIITVSDSGEGFVPGASGGTGTGLDNVRRRLATLCSGTLEIDSDPDGTTATIALPREQE